MPRTAVDVLCRVIPTNALAQDVIGSVTATIDGAARTWQTLRGSGPDESYITYINYVGTFGPFQGISVAE